MTTNQGLKQASARAESSSTGTYNEDMMAMAIAAGFSGTYNELLIQYCEGSSGATWDLAGWNEVFWGSSSDSAGNINGALADFAESNGVVGGSLWSSLGSF